MLEKRVPADKVNFSDGMDDNGSFKIDYVYGRPCSIEIKTNPDGKLVFDGQHYKSARVGNDPRSLLELVQRKLQYRAAVAGLQETVKS